MFASTGTLCPPQATATSVDHYPTTTAGALAPLTVTESAAVAPPPAATAWAEQIRERQAAADRSTRARTPVRAKTAPAKKTTTTVAAGSGAAAKVVAYALAQVGKPYVWGADGPGSYDCSGLTLAAYAQVGISLPHQSGAIAERGRSVRRSELAPGDVVIWSGHVAIYIGGGRIVEAANREAGVRVGQIWGSPIDYRRILR